MISLRLMAHYLSQLALAVRSGIPIISVFKSLAESAPSRRLRKMSNSISNSIGSGSSLSQALMEHRRAFPDLFLNTISAGEQTGHLEEVTKRLADFYTMRYRLVNAVRWQLLSLAVYFFLLFSLVIFIEYVQADWNISVVYSRLQSLLIIIIFGLLIPWALYDHCRPFRMLLQIFFNAVPFVGHVMRKFAVARFASAMALGIQTGMDIRQTIRFAGESMSHIFLERQVRKAIDYIEGGDTIATALRNTGVFPELVNQMFTTGEQSGNLFEMMEHVAIISQEQAENALNTVLGLVPKIIYIAMVIYIGYRIILFWQSIYGSLFSSF